MVTTSRIAAGEKDEVLGKRFEALRTGFNLSQKELSNRLNGKGISPARIKSIEAGADPKLSEIIALSETYEYTPGGLINRLLK